MLPLNILQRYFLLLFILIFFKGNSQYISVNTSTYTPEQLVKNVLIGTQNAGCIEVSNVTLNGWDFGAGNKSYGTFSKNASSFEIDSGIILSTGSALTAVGPNSYIQTQNSSSPFANASWAGDSDLAAALNTSLNQYKNATVLEFDFKANNISGISFEYMFLSEEYQKNPTTSQCNYSDAFAFLIKKAGTAESYKNIALIPNTNIPVSSTTVRGRTQNGNCSPQHEEFFGSYNDRDTPTNFNGQTKTLEAKTDIVPGVLYHIKLVIADHGDSTGLYDSAVFLKGGSFVGKKDLGNDMLFLTDNPLCEGNNKILDATTSGATSYKWFKDGNQIPGATNRNYVVQGIPGNDGFYEVEINLGGCIIKGSIQIDIQKKPVVLLNAVPAFCDSKFSGIPMNFSQISQQVIPGFNRNFVPKYYLTPLEAQNGTTPGLQNGWLLTQTTKLFVRVESAIGCNPVLGETILTVGNKIPLLKNSFSTVPVCNDNFAGVQVNLSNYVSQFTNASVTPTFYNSLEEAKIGNPATAISVTQTLTSTKTFGIRFEGIDCPNVASLTVNIKSPNKSTSLHDETICPNSKIILDAGSGFDYYKWSTGKEGDASVAQKIENVGVGEYWVELFSNGCFYRHSIKLTSAELPQISQVEVSGSTVTVTAIGGVPPYFYSLDGTNFQDSNIFMNVLRGKGTVYLKDSQNCESVTKEFSILNLINVITPNGDGKNDFLDYSDLKLKNNVKMEIYDRYGNLVFASKNNEFIWDGKSNGKPVPTATYWYILNWTEPGSNAPASYTGWILVKNRN